MSVLAPGWRRFFGDKPYPYDLDLVEVRDDTQGQVAFLARVLPPAPATVLDLGCGNGRHARRLHDLGFRVAGVDLQATPRSGFPYVRADISRLPFGTASVDACICLYTSAGYNAPLQHQLREWSRVTRAGGTLVLDLANRRRRVRAGVDRLPGGLGFMLSARARGRRFQVNVAVRRRRVGLYHLSYPEPRFAAVTAAVRAAGWSIETVFGDFDGSPWSRRSPRTLVWACRD